METIATQCDLGAEPVPASKAPSSWVLRATGAAHRGLFHAAPLGESRLSTTNPFLELFLLVVI
jgi:hypothetical protein